MTARKADPAKARSPASRTNTPAHPRKHGGEASSEHHASESAVRQQAGASSATHKSTAPTTPATKKTKLSHAEHSHAHHAHAHVHDKVEPPFKECNSRCSCELKCAANQPLIDVCLQIGELLKQAGENRFAQRQFTSKMPCRLRHLKQPLQRETVKVLAHELGCGPVSQSVFADLVEHGKTGRVEYLEHLKAGKSVDSFTPKLPEWLEAS